MRPWWEDAVGYEIYIRSFQDSNGDGIGDLNGITERLDYLVDLGVDLLWITPFYPSPQIDFGYDISDHEAVDPQFGSLADFDRLVATAHARGLRVVIDLVLNHTSDRHAWFVESRAARHAGKRDWYIWRDGTPDGRPPNNWESAFGGPAWSYDEATGQWYYHFFYAQQPDLNWRNPAVEARMFETVRFWIDRGVDGFRLDAINTLFEDEALRDNPLLPAPRLTPLGLFTQEFVHTRRLPEVHEVLRRLRAFVEQRAPECALFSEAYLDAVDELVRFYGDGRGVHLPFNFFLVQSPHCGAGAFRAIVDEVDRGCGDRWPTLVLSNHDVARASDRYADDAFVEARARVLAMALLTLRGTPFLYYGEEIGLRTEPPAAYAEVRDPVGRTHWPRYKGRDGSRRPMPWTSAGGFTSGTPWLPLPADTPARNVAAQQADPGSLLHLYRALLRLRRDSAALRAGGYQSVDAHPDVFAYRRHANGEVLLVLLNLSRAACPAGVTGRGEIVLGTHARTAGIADAAALVLAAFEGVILRPV